MRRFVFVGMTIFLLTSMPALAQKTWNGSDTVDPVQHANPSLAWEEASALDGFGDFSENRHWDDTGPGAGVVFAVTLALELESQGITEEFAWKFAERFVAWPGQVNIQESDRESGSGSWDGYFEGVGDGGAGTKAASR